MSRFLRACWRAIVTALRAVFLLALIVIPFPVGELVQKLLEQRRRAVAAKVVKKENPD
jgi:hypothetical protein